MDVKHFPIFLQRPNISRSQISRSISTVLNDDGCFPEQQQKNVKNMQRHRILIESSFFSLSAGEDIPAIHFPINHSLLCYIFLNGNWSLLSHTPEYMGNRWHKLSFPVYFVITPRSSLVRIPPHHAALLLLPPLSSFAIWRLGKEFDKCFWIVVALFFKKNSILSSSNTEKQNFFFEIFFECVWRILSIGVTSPQDTSSHAANRVPLSPPPPPPG